MDQREKRKYLLDILLLSIVYALIFTTLIFFIYPIDLRQFSNFSELITAALGAALFFGAISGIITGFIASTWINRLEFHSQIAIGMISGMVVAIIGSILFPPLAAFIRINYFGTNPTEFVLEISLLINYSMIGVVSGTFTAAISGIIGGMMAPSVY
ncbi:MAG: hypothetical protein ACXADY_12970 [Candidatus Hodarchaeales archaeon]|jgi:hypothetical protein